jgi:Ser/Thr protein kinase RdoA (MazF antagonist)
MVSPVGTDQLQALARKALAAYDIGPVSHVTPIDLSNNATFEVRVTDGSRYALRLHRPAFRTVAHTRSELLFLEALHDRVTNADTVVPQPVRTREGELVVEVAVPDRGKPAKRHSDLLTWVAGRVLRPGQGLGPRAVYMLGRALAQLHEAAEEFRPPPGFELPRWDADGMFTEASPFRPPPLGEVMAPDDWSLFEVVEERTRAMFEDLDRKGAPSGIIHADFILLNCHLLRRPAGWRVGIMDFDDLGWGYFVYDLAPLLGNLAEFPGYRSLRAAYLSGYRSVRGLPVALEAHLPVLMAARHAQCCAWVAGIERTLGAGPPVAGHIAYRMCEIRRHLGMI